MNSNPPFPPLLRIRIAVLLALAAGAVLVPHAQAQTSANWNNSSQAIGTNTSWTPNTTPSATFTGNFNNATYTQGPSATADTAFGKLYIGSSSGALTFGSGANTITLSGVSTGGVNMGIEVVSGAGAVNTAGTKFALAANQTWSNNSTNTLSIGGTITNNSSAAPVTLTIDGTGNTTIAGIISNNTATGQTSLIKNGTGTLSLTAANTFSGGLTINTGTVSATPGASGTASNTVTFGGAGAGVLSLTSGVSATWPALLNVASANGTVLSNPFGGLATHTLGGTTLGGGYELTTRGGSNVTSGLADLNLGVITMAGDGSIAVLDNLSGLGTFRMGGSGSTGTGNLTLKLNATSGSSILFIGSYNHNGTITNSGTGTMTPATNAATVAGIYSLNAGALISGAIGSNVSTVTQNSANTPLELSGANTFTGSAQVFSGSLILGHATAASNSQILLGNTSGTANASLLVRGGINIANNILVQAGNTGTSTIGGAGIAAGGASTLSGNLTLNKTATLTPWNNSMTFSGLVTGAGGITVSAAGQTLSTSGQSYGISGSTVILSKSDMANTFAGDTRVLAGTLQLNGNATASASLTGLLGTSTSNAVLLGDTSGYQSARLLVNPGAATQSFSRGFTVQAGSGGLVGVGSTGTQSATLSGSITLNKSGYLYGIAAGATTTTFSGAITKGGSAIGATSLTTSGAGIIKLTSTSNTYDGGSVVGGNGTLWAEGAGALGTGNVVAESGFLQLSDQVALASGKKVLSGPYGGVSIATNSTAQINYVANTALDKASSGAVALGVNIGNNINLADFGNGLMFLGATGPGFTYFNSTLGTNSDGNYRLGAGSLLTVYLGVLNNATAKLIVGSPTNSSLGTGLNLTTGSVLLQGNNTYGGGTEVNIGATLTGMQQATSGSPFGSTSGNMTMRGGNLVLKTPADSTTSNAITATTIGALNFAGSSAIQVQGITSGVGNNTLTVGQITRNGNGVLSIGTITAGTIGTNAFFKTTGTAPTTTSVKGSGNTTVDMAPAYFLDGTNAYFLSYNATTGFSQINPYTSIANATVDGNTGVVRMTANNALSTTGNRTVAALGLVASTLTNTSGADITLKITSGGLASSTGAGSDIGSTTANARIHLDFNNQEAIINTFGGLSLRGGIQNASGITKSGAGSLLLWDTTNTTFVGNITLLNGGGLIIASDLSLGSSGASLNNGIVFNGGTLLVDTSTSFTLSSNRTVTLDTLGGTFSNLPNGSYNSSGIAAGPTVVVASKITGTGNYLNVRPGASVGGTNNLTSVYTFGNATNDFTAPISVGSLVNTGRMVLTFDTNSQLGNATNSVTLIGGSSVLRYTGAGSVSMNRTINFLDQGGGLEVSSATGNLTNSGVLSGSGLFYKLGNGTLTLTGDNIYTANTIVTAGVLNVQSANALGATTAAITGNSGVSGGAVYVQSGAALEIQGAVALNGTGGKTMYLTGTGISNGGALRNVSGNNSNTGAVILQTDTSIGSDSGSLTLSGAVSGASALTKVGLGTLTLNGSNSYSGGTTLSAGALQVGHANALGTSGNITFSGGTMQFASGGSGADYGARIKNSASAIIFDTNGQSVTFAGAMDNSNIGGLTKNGSGTLALSGANTYNGTTTINAGTLALSGASGSVAGPIAMGSGAALQLAHSSDTSIANTLSGAGNIVQTAGTGVATTLAGTNTNTGSIQSTGGGTLLFSGAGALSSTLTGLSASGGSTLSFVDGTTRTITLGNSGISLSSAKLAFDVDLSSNVSDRLDLGQAATLNGTNIVNLNFLNAISSGQTWTLLTAASGLNGTWSLGTYASQSGYSFSLTSDATWLKLTAVAASNDAYWTGQAGSSWANTNFSTSMNGSASLAGAALTGKDVVFAATGADNLTTTLGGDYTMNSLSVSTPEVTINGSNTLNVTSSSSAAIAISAVGNTTINANLAGNAGLTKSGAGTLALGGNNSYSGGTTINGGTVVVGSNTALGNSAVSAGGGNTSTLQSGVGALAISNNFTIGTGSTVAWDTNSQNATLSGAIGGPGALTKLGLGTLTLNGSSTYTGATTVSAGTLALLGSLNGSSLTVSGGVLNQTSTGSIAGAGTTFTLTNGDATLAGNNTYTGATTISAGTLTLSGSLNGSSLTVSGGVLNQTSTGSIAGTGTTFTLTSGNATLAGNNTYTGATTISAGTLEIASTGRLGGGSYAQNITNNGTFIYSGSNNQTLSGILSGTGALTQNNSSSRLTLSGINTYTGATTISAGTLEIGTTGSLGGGSYAQNISNNGAFIYSGASDQTLSGIISGTGALTKNSSASVLFLTNNNSYVGNTTVTAGVLNIQNANALGTTAGGTTVSSGGALQLQGGISVGAEALSLNGTGVTNDGALRSISGSNTYGAAITLSGTTRINSDADLLTLSGGISGAQNLTIGGVGNTTVSGVIATATGNLTKDGVGTLTLSGNNSYTGTTTINGGTLSINSIKNVGGGASSLGNPTTSTNGRITMSGGSLRYTGSGDTSNRTIDLFGNSIIDQSGTGTLAFSSFDATSTAPRTLTLQGSTSGIGEITGAVINWNNQNIQNLTSLTKNGTGTWILSGANSYTAATTINAGTLQIGNGSTTGSLASTSAISNNATLVFNRSNTITQGTDFANVISGTGNLTQNGSGNLTLNSANTYTGATTINAGTLALGASNSIASTSNLNVAGGTFNLAGFNQALGSITGSGNITLGAGTLTTNSSSSTTFSGVISGSGGLTKNGSGALTLSGANTYTGTTTVNAGTLRLGASNVLADTSNLTIIGGTFDISTYSDTVGVVTMTNGNLIGTSGVLTGSTYNITGGNLTAQLGGGSVTINNGTTNVGAIGSAVTFTVNGSSTVAALTANVVASSVSVLNGGSIAGSFSINQTGGVTANSGSIASSLIGSGGVTMNGAGNTFALSGSNSYTGATTISAGTISINAATALGSTSGVSLANGTALLYTGGAGTLGSNITVGSGTGTLRNSGGATLTLGGSLSKNGTTLTFGQGAFNVTGSITGSAANSDLVVDAAAVTLNGENTYNGPTFLVNGATLNANAAGALPTGPRTAVTMDATGSGSSTLALGASQSVASLTGAASSNVTLGANTLTLGTTSGSTTYVGRITGGASSALVKDGASTQVLTGNNSAFTGTTTINSGTLVAGAANAAGGTSSVIINNGGSFLVTADNAVGANTAIELNGGRMAMGGNFNENVGALTLSANSTIDFADFVGTLRFSGIGSWVSGANLAIWNWSGTTQYGTQINNYANPSNLVFDNTTNLASNLAKISFYSDSGNSFVGSGFEVSGFSGGGSQIIAVPEAETYFCALALLGGIAIYYLRRKAKRNPLEGQPPA